MTRRPGLVEQLALALGRPQGDDRILEAAGLVAVPFEIDAFGPGEEYWSFNGEGVEFAFGDDRLRAIMFHLPAEPDDPELGVWTGPLLDGLPLDCTAAQAREALGEPQASGSGDRGPWHRFALGDVLLHLEFDEVGCRMATLMAEAP